jgi:hypothetical protein
MPDYQPHTIRQTAEYSAPTFKENSAPFDTGTPNKPKPGNYRTPKKGLLQVQYRALEQLRPAPRNARTHSPA